MKNFTLFTSKTWGFVLVLALTFACVKLSAQFQINLDLQSPSCEGYSNGQAEVDPAGGQEPYSYQWSSGQTGKIAWSLTGGDYSVVVTDANGQSVSESFSLQDPEDIQVEISTDGDDCTATEYTATVSGGTPAYSYKWSNGATSAVINNPTESYLAIEVTDANGCLAKDAKTVKIPLQVSLDMKDVSCSGYSDGNSVVDIAGGKMPYSIKWSTGSSDNGSMYISGLAAGNYSVTVEDANGCSMSASGTIGEPEMTQVTLIKDQECGIPTTVTAITTGGVGPHMFMWIHNGDLVSTDSIYTFNEPNTLYLCVMNADHCPHDNWVTVSPGFELKAVISDADCDNNLGSINLSPTSIVGPAVYQWEGPNGFTAETQDIDNLEGGTYSVTATDAGGCSATYSTTISHTGETMTLDEALLSTKQCDAQNVNFNNTNPNSDQYHWVFPDGTTSAGSSTSFDFSSLGEGIHTVYLAPNDNPCAETVAYEVNVAAPAIADFDFKLEGCLDSIVFTDMSNVPAGITGWTWDFGGNEFKEQNPILPAGMINGDFNAKLTLEFPEGCSIIIEKEIKVVSVEINIPETALICDENGSVNLNPGGNPDYQYTWSPATGLDDASSFNPTASPTSNQVYTVDVVDTNGAESCMVSQQVMVVYAPISMEAFGDTIVCDAAAMVPLEATHNGDDFGWYDNEALTGTPVSTALNFMASPGTYYAASTNAAGCQVVEEIIVTASPISTGVIQDQFDLCNEEEATLEVDSPSSADHIEWFLGTESVGMGSSILVNPNESSEYTVVVTNTDGCSASATAQVNVFEVSVDASVEPKEIYRGQTADLGSDGGFISYAWTPDDGSIDNPGTANPVITPEVTTTYTLIVTDENGCTASSSTTIEVKETECGEPFIFLPNAFSPNGDGNGNDVLYLHGLNLSEIQLSIYNRWGQMVFETRDQSLGWDGTFNGEPVVPDVYGFYLRVICDNGEKYFKKGNITVLK